METFLINSFFDISKFPDYGNLSKKNLDDLNAGSRVELDQNKKNKSCTTDWKYQNQPWFSPHKGKHIQSIFFGVGNTYLTLHKQLITGYGHAKTFGYEKVHFIEYVLS